MGLSDGAFFMIKHTPLPNGSSRYIGAKALKNLWPKYWSFVVYLDQEFLRTFDRISNMYIYCHCFKPRNKDYMYCHVNQLNSACNTFQLQSKNNKKRRWYLSLKPIFFPGKDTFYHHDNISRDKARGNSVRWLRPYLLISVRLWNFKDGGS